MQYFYEVETQGLSPDWRHATGDSMSVSRGKMSLSDVENALKHVVDVDMTKVAEGDFFPPHIMVTTDSGLLRFSLAGRSLYCAEAGRVVSYDEACSLVRGETKVRTRGRLPGKRPSSSPRAPWWRRLIGTFVGLPLVAFGGLVIATSIEDNNLEGGLVGGGLFILVGGIVYWLALGRSRRSARRKSTGARRGTRQTETGAMHTPTMYDHTYDKDERREGMGDPSGDTSGDSFGDGGGADSDSGD